ncbi:MAG: PDZ domain-containing protein, partial [Anaerolineae bacterium]|nr:PDZ domain-containing protein [Anaerolineae bacterium]
MSITQPVEKKRNFDKALEISVLLFQAIAIIAFILILISATKWLKSPFMGAFVEHSLLFNGVGTEREDINPEAWQLFNAGLSLGDQLKEIDGHTINSVEDITNALAQHTPNDEVQITYENIEKGELTKTIQLISFPNTDKFKFFYVPYGIGLGYLLLGLWMSRLRLSESLGRAFILFATSFALSSAALFNIYTTHEFTILWTFSVALTGGALLDLSLSFPRDFDFVKENPHIRRVGYAIALLLGLLAIPSIYNTQYPSLYISRWRYIYGLTGFSIVFFIGTLFYRGRTDRSPIAKQQIKMVWWGILLSFAPISIFLLYSSFVQPINFSPYLIVPALGFPIVSGYAILRYRLAKIDFLISRGLVIISLSTIASIGYVLILWGLSLIATKSISPNNPIALGVFIAILALLT